MDIINRWKTTASRDHHEPWYPPWAAYAGDYLPLKNHTTI